MVSVGTILALTGIGLALFFSKDISTALGNLKGFGSEFGRDFGKLPDVNINIPDFKLPDFGNPFEGVPQAFADAGAGLGVAGANFQKSIEESIANAQKGIDQSIKTAQEDFEQFGKDVQTNIADAGEANLVFGADIQEFFTGNRNAIGDFFDPTKQTSGAPETTPTVTTPATIERQAGRRTFGGQTQPKMTLTKTQASTPEESKVIISAQPDLTKVSPFLTNFQKVEGAQITSRRTGRSSR